MSGGSVSERCTVIPMAETLCVRPAHGCDTLRQTGFCVDMHCVASKGQITGKLQLVVRVSITFVIVHYAVGPCPPTMTLFRN